MAARQNTSTGETNEAATPTPVPATNTDTNTGTTAEAQAAKARHMLRLQGPRGKGSITHLGFQVGKKLIEVPIGGELEVSETDYAAITRQELSKGYSWGDTMAAGTTPTPTGSSTSPVQPNTGSAGQ